MNTSINNKVYKVLNDRITNEISTVNTNYKAEDSRLQGEIDKINNTTIDKKVNDLKTTLEGKYDPEISTIKQTISDNQSDIIDNKLPSLKTTIETDYNKKITDESNERKKTDSSLKTDIDLLTGKVNTINNLIGTVDKDNNKNIIEMFKDVNQSITDIKQSIA